MSAPLFARYEAGRARLARWVDLHYIKEFGLKPCRLLDAGCGNGFWGSLFADRGFTVDAVDVDPEYIEDGRALYPSVNFTVADIEAPLDLGQYDVIFGRGLPQFYAQHLDGMARAVANLAPHLNAGGLLLCAAYSNGTGRALPLEYGGLAWHHRDADLIETVARFLPIERSVRAGNYLQIAARSVVAKGPEFYDELLTHPSSAFFDPPDDGNYAPMYAAVAALVPEGANVVELGSGTGRLASLIVPTAASYIGIDFSSSMVAEARRFLPDTDFRVGDVRDPLPVGDCYVMTELLEHLDDDLALIERIPVGATVVLSVPSFASESHLRYFPAQGEARRRYEGLLAIDHEEVVGLPRKGAFFHVLRGTRR